MICLTIVIHNINRNFSSENDTVLAMELAHTRLSLPPITEPAPSPPPPAVTTAQKPESTITRLRYEPGKNSSTTSAQTPRPIQSTAPESEERDKREQVPGRASMTCVSRSTFPRLFQRRYTGRATSPSLTSEGTSLDQSYVPGDVKKSALTRGSDPIPYTYRRRSSNWGQPVRSRSLILGGADLLAHKRALLEELALPSMMKQEDKNVLPMDLPMYA